MFKQKIIVDCGDWDALVMKTYGKPYCFQQQDGCQDRGLTYTIDPTNPDPEDYTHSWLPEEINGPDMGVSFKAWLARDPKEWNGEPEEKRFVNMFWERNFYPHVESLASDLYKKGLIPADKFQIEIDW